MAVDSSEIGLWFSHANIKIYIGAKRLVGWCTRGKPELGRLAAEESEAELCKALAGARKVIINVGLGSGTGTGAAPVVARLAKEAGAHTVALVTKPFYFEGGGKFWIVRYGMLELLVNSDLLVIFPKSIWFFHWNGSQFH